MRRLFLPNSLSINAKLSLLFSILLLCILNIGTLTGQEIHVRDNQENNDVFSISMIEKIIFDQNDGETSIIFMQKDESTNSYLVDELRFIIFSDQVQAVLDYPDENNIDIRIYPNPATNVLRILTEDNDFEIFGYRIFDLKGNLVKSYNQDYNRSDGDFEIPFSNQRCGMYILVLDTENGSYNFCFFKN